MVLGALIDVDGTLIDSNMLHVLAWRRAFARLGRQVEACAILHCIGMGGERVARAILGDVDDRVVDEARAIHAEEYVKKGLIDAAEPLPGAQDLLRALRGRGVRIALASSARKEELDRCVARLGGEGVADAYVAGEQVAATKPSPDVFARAIDALGKPPGAFAVGDTVFDVEAARKLGVPCFCVLTGGLERELLASVGPAGIYDDAAALARDLDDVLDVARRAVGVPR